MSTKGKRIEAIVMSVFGSPDRDIEVSVQCGIKHKVLIEAVREMYSIVPIGFELNENIYRVILVMPSYYNIDSVFPALGEILISYISSEHAQVASCVVADDMVDKFQSKGDLLNGK